jgi:uncharacterized protein
MKAVFCFFIMVISFSALAQNIETVNSKRFIEITALAEAEVVPDEIYLTITLQERPDNREKLTIAKQEEALKQGLKELGIDLSNLALNSADADYRQYRMFKKDVMISKSYILKVNNADMLGKVYEKLDQMNAFDAFVSKVSHSKIPELTKENRIKAIKAGKEKADYLLGALGQVAGPPLQISEGENFIEDPFQFRGPRMAMKNVYSKDNEMEEAESRVNFRKIKIRSSYHIKFEILNK